MVEQTVQTGEDGALDHHGETLPPLSKSASRINVEKIESKRRIASKAGDHPGVGWFYRMIRGLSRLAMNQQFRTIEVTGQEHIAEDAGILYHLLESEVVPSYYDRDESGLPQRWISMMKESIVSAIPQFSTQRMLVEYADLAYLPLGAQVD